MGTERHPGHVIPRERDDAEHAALLKVPAGDRLFRGTVFDLATDGSVLVTIQGQAVACDVLRTGAPLAPAIGESVLVWLEGPLPAARGIIMGLLARGSREDPEPCPPDTLVIEARTSLTLKVGDGSITIREDGSILIKGKDLVSHAKRRNRIRGGSVEIN